MNRYIKAMEIGLANEENGITYFDLSAQVQKELKIKFGRQSELTFLVWFGENFSKSDINLKKEDYNNFKYWHSGESDTPINEAQNKRVSSIKFRLGLRYWLNGTAAKQYLDYKEYKAARRNSLVATVFATISILIAAVSFYTDYNSVNLEPKQSPGTDRQQLRQIEQRIEYLEETFTKEVDTLKNTTPVNGSS